MFRPPFTDIDSLTDASPNMVNSSSRCHGNAYAEVALMKQLQDPGTVIVLTFVLTVENPFTISKSRDAGCYVGLRTKRTESGQSRRQLGICKEGDSYLRKLLVQGPHYILGRYRQDTDLRR